MTRRKRMSYNTMVRKERGRKKQWREERSRMHVSESDSDDHDEVPLSQLKVKLSEDEVDTQEQLKDLDTDTDDEVPLVQTKIKLRPDVTETKEETQGSVSNSQKSSSDQQLKDLEIRLSPLSFEEANKLTKTEDQNPSPIDCDDSDTDSLEEFPIIQTKNKIEETDTEMKQPNSTSEQHGQHLKNLEIRLSPIRTEQQIIHTEHKDKDTSPQNSDDSTAEQQQTAPNHQLKDLEIRLSPIRTEELGKQTEAKDKDEKSIQPITITDDSTSEQQPNAADHHLKDLEIRLSPLSIKDLNRQTELLEDKDEKSSPLLTISDESDSDNPNEVLSNQTKVKCKQTDRQELTQNTKAVDPPLKDLEIRLSPIGIEEQNRWAQTKQGNITSSPYSCENSEQKQSESTQHLKQHLKQLQITLSPLSIEEQIRWTKVKEEKIDSSQQSSDKQMSVNCLKDLEIRLFPLSIEEQIRWTKVKEEKIDSSQLSCNQSESVNCLKDLEIRLCPLSVEEQIKWTKVKEEKKDNYEKPGNSQQRSLNCLKDLEIRLSPLSIEEQVRWTKVEKEKIDSSQLSCDDSDSDDCDEVPLSQLKKRSYKKQQCGLMEPMKMLKIKLFPIDTEEHKKWTKIKEVNKMSSQHNCDNLPSDRQFSKFQLKDLEIQLSPIDLDHLDTHKAKQKFGFGSRKRPIVVEDEDDLSPSCCDNNKVPRLLDNQQKLSDDIVSVPDLVLCSDTHKNSNMDSTRSTRSGKKRRIGKRNDSHCLLPDRPLTPMFDDSDQDEDFSDIVLDIPNLF